MMGAGRRAYFAGVAAGAAGRTAGALAGVASLWLLARILPKDQLGGYAFGMALVGLTGVLATLGLDRTLLLRIAARAPRSGGLRGRALALRTAAAAVAAGALLAVVVALFAGDLARLGAPGAERWLLILSLSIPPSAAAATLVVWLQANHRPALAASAQPLTDVTRCLLLGTVLATGLGATAVAWCAVLAAAAPLLVLGPAAVRRSTAAPGRILGTDFILGAQFLTVRFTTQSARQLDLLLLGLFSTGAATAEYAVAVRLAAMADYGRNALKPVFTARIRRHLASGDRAAAEWEHDAVRTAAVAFALAMAAILALVGDEVLALFGDFAAAQAPLMALAAAYVVNAGFGMNQAWLAMHGEVSLSSAMRVGALALLAGALAILAPRYGALGASLAVLLHTTVVNALTAALAWRLTSLAPGGAAMLVMVLVPAAALTAAALGALGGAAASTCALGAAAAAVWRLRDVIRTETTAAWLRLRALIG